MTRILVIEDEEAVRENILELLLAEGYESWGAEDGESGLRQIWEKAPDLVICDVLMPGLNGYGVLATINRTPQLAHIPFLFLTARVDREDIRKGMALGADDYITKPFTRKDLLTAIKIRLGKREKLEEFVQSKLEGTSREVLRRMPEELSAPLRLISGLSEHLRHEADQLQTVDIRRLANLIHQSSDQLGRLFQDYLMYMELEAVLRTPERLTAYQQVEKLACGATIRGIAGWLVKDAQRENDVLIKVEDGWAAMLEEHLVKIVEELLLQAFQNSRIGKPITLEGKPVPEKGQYTLQISDQGAGYSLDQILQLTGKNRHYRIPMEDHGRIGMHLIRQIVKLYHGEFQIKSQPGEETHISLRLPLAVTER